MNLHKPVQPELAVEQAEFCANPRCLFSMKDGLKDSLPLMAAERVKVSGRYFCGPCSAAAMLSAMAESRWMADLQARVHGDARDTYSVERNMSTRSVERSLIDDALEATAELIRDGSSGQFATALLKLVAVMASRGWTLRAVLEEAGRLMELGKAHPLPDVSEIERILHRADTAKKLSDALSKIRGMNPRFATELEGTEIGKVTAEKPALVEYVVRVRLE